MENATDSNRANGDRGPDGRFRPGCRPGPGNPRLRKLASWRAEFDKAISPAAFRAVISKLVREARDGRQWACELLLKYALPLPVDADLLEKIEKIERQLLGQEND